MFPPGVQLSTGWGRGTETPLRPYLPWGPKASIFRWPVTKTVALRAGEKKRKCFTSPTTKGKNSAEGGGARSREGHAPTSTCTVIACRLRLKSGWESSFWPRFPHHHASPVLRKITGRHKGEAQRFFSGKTQCRARRPKTTQEADVEKRQPTPQTR